MLPYDYKVKMIKQAIDEIDPMGLLSLNCLKDEYLEEAKLLAEKIELKRSNIVDGKIIEFVFYKQFDEKLSSKIISRLATRIARYLNLKTISEELESNKFTKDKVTISNGNITLKIHDKFIVKYCNYKLYINDKFYKNVKLDYLLKLLIDLITNDDIIYVQYLHKRLKGYFKKFKRSEYNYYKIKRHYDIEYVFDNKELLDFSGLKNISEEEIINIMYKQKIKEDYEKLFYSKDKKKRLIVYKNNVGSYSYFVEKLTIVDLEERQWYGTYAIWESDYNDGSYSFYESMDSLLMDIDYMLVDMEETYDC